MGSVAFRQVFYLLYPFNCLFIKRGTGSFAADIIITDSVKLNQFYVDQKLDVESEALIIYMKESLNLDSDVYVFPIEETEDDLVFEKDGVKYVQFFPIEYALDLIESDLGLKASAFTDKEIAERLLEYRLRDV